MALQLTILGIISTAAVVIFGILFIYLVAKWSIKRGKELSKKFEYETKELHVKDQKLRDIEKRIDLLKTKHEKAITNNDLNTADSLSKEIKKLEKQRERILRKMQQY